MRRSSVTQERASHPDGMHGGATCSGTALIGSRPPRAPVVALLALAGLAAILTPLAILPSTVFAAPPASAGLLPERAPEAAQRLVTRAPLPGEIEGNPLSPDRGFARADTIDFGFYEVREDGLKYAVRGETWTFDHGAIDPLEGWVSDDLTENDGDYWRRVTEAIWLAEGNPLPWPQMNASSGIVLCGMPEPQADSLGWVNGLGYGNDWCQLLTSPALNYDGSGEVELRFSYFNETEANYDYSRVFVLVGSTRTPLNEPGFNGRIGIDTLGVITEQTYLRSIQNSEMGGGSDPRDFRIVLEFNSDGAMSDEDGLNGWDASYGAWGVDDVSLSNNLSGGDVSYDFDADLQGWTASRCPGNGSLMGVAPLSDYVILDPCGCELAGNVLEMHNDLQMHPPTQHEYAISPIVDRKSDIGDPQYLEYNRFLCQWDMYTELPSGDMVYYRPGWRYYPWEDPNIPGRIAWSPREGSNTYLYTGDTPICFEHIDIATNNGIPPTAEKVKFIFELLYDCGEWIPCGQFSNFTPIMDNFRVRNTRVPAAPAIAFDVGCRFQDGFPQETDGLLSAYGRGNADIVFDKHLGVVDPVRLGDSLVVQGPFPTADSRWESRLWLRLNREGPVQEQLADFLRWKRALLAKGIDFTPPQSMFSWAYMDSVEYGVQVAKNRFCSQFRDGPSTGGWNLPADICFNWGGGGEQAEGNEIIPDHCLTPGTQIQYFATSNYTCTPGEYWYLPDTLGGYFEEFEILPSYRLDGEMAKFPCVLYVDAFNRGAQGVIEAALNATLNGAAPGDPVPNPTSWDRYDYLDASTSWNAPLFRAPGGNNGATLCQLLGYRLILFDTGTYGNGSTEPEDWQGLAQWLDSPVGDAQQQGLLAEGNSVADIISYAYPALLTQKLGATYSCTNYSDLGCPPGEPENDENFCVRLEPVPGAPFVAGIPLDAFGNWCPADFDFDVLGATGSGAGNKYYEKVGTGTRTSYAQIANDQAASAHRYRTVLSGSGLSAITARDLDVAPDPDLECPYDMASRVAGATAEIDAALTWLLGGDPQSIGRCVPPASCQTDLSGLPQETPGTALVNRLYPSAPNPFNPRTTIRYSLAQAGPAMLAIYDVSGRRVRTLVDGPQTAGAHEAVWDGTNDRGLRVAGGVYWSRLSAAAFESNRRMVVVK